MIQGIGIDLVQITRMAKVIERWRDRFIQRVFTPDEIEYCRSMIRPEIYCSARLAAKEAFLKSAGVGLGAGIRLADIEVRKLPQEQPFYVYMAKQKNCYRGTA